MELSRIKDEEIIRRHLGVNTPDWVIANVQKAIDEALVVNKHYIEEVLGTSQPWPLVDVIKKLVESADILLHKKDYDGDKWEEIEICFNRGKEIIKVLNLEV